MFDNCEKFWKNPKNSEAYTRSGEWQLVHCPVMVNHREDDPLYEDITFYFIIRRKPLFYVINILIPCVLISSLAIFTFLLPSASNQKVNFIDIDAWNFEYFDNLIYLLIFLIFRFKCQFRSCSDWRFIYFYWRKGLQRLLWRFH